MSKPQQDSCASPYLSYCYYAAKRLELYRNDKSWAVSERMKADLRGYERALALGDEDIAKRLIQLRTADIFSESHWGRVRFGDNDRIVDYLLREEARKFKSNYDRVKETQPSEQRLG